MASYRIDSTGEYMFDDLIDRIEITSNQLNSNIINTSNAIELGLSHLKRVLQISYDEDADKYQILFKTDGDPSNLPTFKIDEDQKLKNLVTPDLITLGAIASTNPLFYPALGVKIASYIANGEISIDPTGLSSGEEVTLASITDLLSGDLDFGLWFNTGDVLFNLLTDMVSTELHSGANSAAIALLTTNITSLAALLGYTIAGEAFVTSVNEIEDLVFGNQISKLKNSEISEKDGFNSTQFVVEYDTSDEAVKYISYRSAIEHLIRAENVARTASRQNGSYTYEPTALDGVTQTPRLQIDANVQIADAYKISQLTAPTNVSDLTNKQYVDDAVSALGWSQSDTTDTSGTTGTSGTESTSLTNYKRINVQNAPIIYTDAYSYLKSITTVYFYMSGLKTINWGTDTEYVPYTTLNVNGVKTKTLTDLYYTSTVQNYYQIPKTFLHYTIQNSESGSFNDNWNSIQIPTISNSKVYFMGMTYYNPTESFSYYTLFTTYWDNDVRFKVTVRQTDNSQNGFQFQLSIKHPTQTQTKTTQMFEYADYDKPHTIHVEHFCNEGSYFGLDVPITRIYIDGILKHTQSYDKAAYQGDPNLYDNQGINKAFVGTNQINVNGWNDDFYYSDVYFGYFPEILPEYNYEGFQLKIHNNIQALTRSDLDVRGTISSDRLYTNSIYIGDRLLDVSSLGNIGGAGGATISSTDDIPEGINNKFFTTSRLQTYLTQQNYATIDYVMDSGYATTNAVRSIIDSCNYITSYSLPDLTPYALTENIPSLADYLTSNAVQNLGYATSNYINSNFQPKLTQGTYISIIDNVISVVGGGGGTEISNTDFLPEGTTNKYYTENRVEAYLTSSGYVKEANMFDGDYESLTNKPWTSNVFADSTSNYLQYKSNRVFDEKIVYHKTITTRYRPSHVGHGTGVTPIRDYRGDPPPPPPSEL